jgi:hypothetical protein
VRHARGGDARGNEDVAEDEVRLARDLIDDQVLVREVRGFDVRPAGKGVAGPHHHHHLVPEERTVGETRVLPRPIDDREVDHPVEERGQRVVGGARHHLEVHVGMLALEQAEARGQPVVDGVALGGETEAPAPARRLAPDLHLRALHLLEDAPRGPEEPLPRRGQHHALADAVEEPRVEPLLGVPELVAEGGLAQVEAAARPRHSPFLRDRPDELQVAYVEHGVASSAMDERSSSLS